MQYVPRTSLFETNLFRRILGQFEWKNLHILISKKDIRDFLQNCVKKWKLLLKIYYIFALTNGLCWTRSLKIDHFPQFHSIGQFFHMSNLLRLMLLHCNISLINPVNHKSGVNPYLTFLTFFWLFFDFFDFFFHF